LVKQALSRSQDNGPTSDHMDS